MQVAAIVIGLLGTVFCAGCFYGAWKGGSGIPLGAIFGGALGGITGAAIGGVVDGTKAKPKKVEPNVGGMVFWALVGAFWVACLMVGLFGDESTIKAFLDVIFRSWGA